MTAKQFYDWQTSGGTNDVMRMIQCLERLKDCADIARLVEAHPELHPTLPEHIRNLLDPPTP